MRRMDAISSTHREHLIHDGPGGGVPEIVAAAISMLQRVTHRVTLQRAARRCTGRRPVDGSFVTGAACSEFAGMDVFVVAGAVDPHRLKESPFRGWRNTHPKERNGGGTQSFFEISEINGGSRR